MMLPLLQLYECVFMYCINNSILIHELEHVLVYMQYKWKNRWIVSPRFMRANVSAIDVMLCRWSGTASVFKKIQAFIYWYKTHTRTHRHNTQIMVVLCWRWYIQTIGRDSYTYIVRFSCRTNNIPFICEKCNSGIYWCRVVYRYKKCRLHPLHRRV